MARHYEDWQAACPFYRWDSGKQITCEGCGGGCCNTGMFFPERSKLIAYKRRFCRTNWKKCPVAKMLGEKYEE